MNTYLIITSYGKVITFKADSLQDAIYEVNTEGEEIIQIIKIEIY